MADRPNRLLLAAAICAAAVAATAAACSGGSAQRSLATVTTQPAPATTSSLPTSTSTTVVVPTTTTETTVPADQPTPEDRAKAFYEAWTRNDRAAAEMLGEPAAVAATFARQWSAGDGWSFSECSGAAGSVICTWDGSSQQLQLLVRGATGGLSVTVVDAKFG